jgi:hypothetical protein
MVLHVYYIYTCVEGNVLSKRIHYNLYILKKVLTGTFHVKPKTYKKWYLLLFG